MAIEFFDWGISLTDPELEQVPEALQAFAAVCADHSACENQGYARNMALDQYMVILDIGDGTFELDNQAGILRNERIAVSYKTNEEFCWEVRPLRRDFPVTLHQNHVLEGEPRSLCLYMENWRVVERTWTPESFLQRILWWLRSTADGTIHADDQPVEQLFFDSPITIQLPSDHADKSDDAAYRLVFHEIHPEGTKQITLRGRYALVDEVDEKQTPTCIPILLMLSPIENGPVEQRPTTLGSLQDLVTTRGSDLLEPLKSVIEERAGRDGLSGEASSEIRFILVILGIPRTRNGQVEKTELLGFVVKAGLGELGELLGILHKSLIGDNKWYIDHHVSGTNITEASNWKNLSLDLVRVQHFPCEKRIRAYSGLDANDAGPRGILVGVGALGSTIAQLWKREAWGKWHFVDSDILRVHNIVRHIATHDAIGKPKTQVVRLSTDTIFEQTDKATNQDYVGSITDDDPGLLGIVKKSDILIDVTTTLYVPRDLAERDDVPRVASVFFTPSGSASVMLLEDQQRTIRSNQLEARYYRAILSSEWGKSHLDGHQSQFWVGAGCRDASVALSYEMVQLHGATLARQLRKAISHKSAKICVWDYDEETGGITPYNIPVTFNRSAQLGQWRIVWDHSFEKSIRAERIARLPNETGGMLLGIVDHKTSTITLVAWTQQPPDSITTPSSFVRGTEGQAELMNECHRRTAEIVSYVGEWHSHPPDHSAAPSADDRKQLASITDEFAISSTTPMMMIVADHVIGLHQEDGVVIVQAP